MTQLTTLKEREKAFSDKAMAHEMNIQHLEAEKTAADQQLRKLKESVDTLKHTTAKLQTTNDSLTEKYAAAERIADTIKTIGYEHDRVKGDTELLKNEHGRIKEAHTSLMEELAKCAVLRSSSDRKPRSVCAVAMRRESCATGASQCSACEESPGEISAYTRFGVGSC